MTTPWDSRDFEIRRNASGRRPRASSGYTKAVAQRAGEPPCTSLGYHPAPVNALRRPALAPPEDRVGAWGLELSGRAAFGRAANARALAECPSGPARPRHPRRSRRTRTPPTPPGPRSPAVPPRQGRSSRALDASTRYGPHRPRHHSRSPSRSSPGPPWGRRRRSFHTTSRASRT